MMKQAVLDLLSAHERRRRRPVPDASARLKLGRRKGSARKGVGGFLLGCATRLVTRDSIGLCFPQSMSATPTAGASPVPGERSEGA